MLQSVFGMPIFQVSVEQHAATKEAILAEIMLLKADPRCTLVGGAQTVYSDYKLGNDKHTFKYRDMVLESVRQHIEDFARSVGAQGIELGQIWFQRYETRSFHDQHNHWPSLYSVVYYLEFNPIEHKPTIFLNPCRLEIEHYRSRNIEMPNSYQPVAKEGDMVIFPGFMDHFAPINESTKPRTIVSFNFDLVG